jgi:hypothetical protein
MNMNRGGLLKEEPAPVYFRGAKAHVLCQSNCFRLGPSLLGELTEPSHRLAVIGEKMSAVPHNCLSIFYFFVIESLLRLAMAKRI